MHAAGAGRGRAATLALQTSRPGIQQQPAPICSHGPCFGATSGQLTPAPGHTPHHAAADGSAALAASAASALAAAQQHTTVQAAEEAAVYVVQAAPHAALQAGVSCKAGAAAHRWHGVDSIDVEVIDMMSNEEDEAGADVEGAEPQQEPQPEPQLLLGLPPMPWQAVLDHLSGADKCTLLRTSKLTRDAVLMAEQLLIFSVGAMQNADALVGLMAQRTDPLCLMLHVHQPPNTAFALTLLSLATQPPPSCRVDHLSIRVRVAAAPR